MRTIISILAVLAGSSTAMCANRVFIRSCNSGECAQHLITDSEMQEEDRDKFNSTRFFQVKTSTFIEGSKLKPVKFEWQIACDTRKPVVTLIDGGKTFEHRVDMKKKRGQTPMYELWMSTCGGVKATFDYTN